MKRNGVYTIVIFVWMLIAAQVIFPQSSSPEKPSPGNKTTVTQYKEYGNSFKSNKTDYVLVKRKNSENYFRIDKSGRTLWNGKHWQPADYPLTVFVKNSSSRYFKQVYRSFVDYALSIWESADPRIKFKYVSHSADADITVEFEDDLISKYDDNYLGITDYKINDDRKITRSYIEIGLLKFSDERVTDGEVKATIIHEFGHALGLGHSENETDIMFPFINPFSGTEMEYDDLSGGDVEAVRSVVNLGFGLQSFINKVKGNNNAVVEQ